MEIVFDKECRDKLISGINKLAKAVGSTIGPKGKTCIIYDENTGKYRVTKDGVSVARSINFKNPIENIGAQMFKEVAELTLKLAGDGTTTATVLAAALINNLKDFEISEVNKALDEIIPKVLEQLKLNARILDRKDIKYVATISANNDVQIGDIIQQAFNFSDIVKLEDANDFKDSVECVSGMDLKVSYFSKHFITNQNKGICEFNEPNVLILDGKLDKLENFREPLELCSNGESLLIIVEHIHEQALRKLESLVLSNDLKICVIKSPGFGPHRKDLLRDLSDFTGATVITDLNKSYNKNVLGKLSSCVISKYNSILTKHDDINIDELIKSLSDLRKSKDLEQHDKDLLDKRVEGLTGKVSIIKVGGSSDIEMLERKDRYDDAVLAVACALEEGIVQGAGLALYHSIQDVYNLKYDEKTAYHFVMKSLLSPYDTICKNGTCIPVMNDMFKQNIIDPLKVTRCALESAVSIARTILSTDTIVLNERQWME